MRLFRVLRGPIASPDDFASLEARGRPVPPGAPDVVRHKWGAISFFTTLELAARRAADRDLGSWWAALDLPEDADLEIDPAGPLGAHASVFHQRPDQLLSYVVETGEFDREDDRVE